MTSTSRLERQTANGGLCLFVRRGPVFYICKLNGARGRLTTLIGVQHSSILFHIQYLNQARLIAYGKEGTVQVEGQGIYAWLTGWCTKEVPRLSIFNLPGASCAIRTARHNNIPVLLGADSNGINPSLLGESGQIGRAHV